MSFIPCSSSVSSSTRSSLRSVMRFWYLNWPCMMRMFTGIMTTMMIRPTKPAAPSMLQSMKIATMSMMGIAHSAWTHHSAHENFMQSI
jgi:cobalamin-dependent methionine synthase I